MSILNNAGLNGLIEQWFTKHVKTNVQKRIIPDKKGKFLHIDVDGDVLITDDSDSKWPPYIKFGRISGSFTCCNSQISSMIGFPLQISKNFICMSCHNISSLEGIPKLIKGNCRISNCGKLFTETEIKKFSSIKGNVYLK